jgi:integrase
MNRVFISALGGHIARFVGQKHALGYPYTDSERIVYNFDKFCKECYPHEKTITEEMGLHWATMRTTEGKKGFCTRVGVVRELARFMLREGTRAYLIPTDLGKHPNARYQPHIFTDSELKRIFEASDYLAPSKHDPTCHLVAPVLFRLLYTCGLRPIEGRLIKRANIDLENGTLFIPESKGHKDRVVVMSDDMTALCRKYDSVMRVMKPDSEYFFPANRKNPALCHHWIADTLWRCWENAGICGYSGNKPRPYDFRHTFATKTLYRWLKEGRDLDNCLPYLSAYMGHAHFEHTAYYIHLVPEYFPQMAQMDLGRFADLLPEVEL